MDGVIIMLMFGIGFIVEFLYITLKYEKITGIATGNGSKCYEEYEYDYLGVHYIEQGLSYFSFHRKGKQYTIWVRKDHPDKVVSKNFYLFMSTGFLFVIGALYLFTYYISF